jgi:hypothetical protein
MSVLAKLAGLGATLGAGLLAKKMMDTARFGRAGQPPRKKEAHQGRGVPGIIWFALTAAGTGAIIYVLTGRATKAATLRFSRTPRGH